MELNFEGLEMQKSNIPVNKAQIIYEVNGIICQVIMFIPVVMVIIMSKIAHFCIFWTWEYKNQSVWKKYSSASERSFLAISKYAMNFWIMKYH